MFQSTKHKSSQIHKTDRERGDSNQCNNRRVEGIQLTNIKVSPQLFGTSHETLTGAIPLCFAITQ
jgi:hypothetical protein